jgi:GDP-4-dehydro-6-deoxy-D-mannose reductase
MAWGEANREGLADIAPPLKIVDGDVTDSSSLAPVLEAARPDRIFHLAAASSVASSWSSPSQALTINAGGQIHLLEAVRAAGLAPRIVVPSSAEVYGRVSGAVADETMAPAPLSPYAVSKATQELIATQYGGSWGLELTCLRLFNITGPGQYDCFAASSFARQIAEIEIERRAPVIRVGNLEARRDFTDVRDAAAAFWLAAAIDPPGGVFNLCSGTAVPLREVLDTLLALGRRPIEVEVESARLRRADIPELCGSPGRLVTATGWRPRIPLHETLRDLLEWWRHRLAVNPAPRSDSAPPA